MIHVYPSNIRKVKWEMCWSILSRSCLEFKSIWWLLSVVSIG